MRRDYRSAPSVGQGDGLRPAWLGTTETFAGSNSLDDLFAAVGAAGSVRRGIGVGRLVEFRVDRWRGSALVAEGQVVHVAIL